jgi:hypothetical protein
MLTCVAVIITAVALQRWFQFCWLAFHDPKRC